MKKIATLMCALFLGALCVIGAEAAPKKLKVLMIGNSFSICVGNHLPAMVAASDGIELELTSAYIGGCPLRKHWANVEKAEKDANDKPYMIDVWDSKKKGYKVSRTKNNINDLLKNNQYDIITIQQASHESWKYENYQPFADNLIEYIRKHNPKAEIVIQMTWSYRADDGRLKLDKGWKMDNTGMYNKLKEAYTTLAKKHKFRVIPVGDAVQVVRAKSDTKFVVPTSEERASYKYPDYPRQAGEVVGNYGWRKDQKTGKQTLGADTIHLNNRGHYLQAAVWYAILFGRDATEIKYNASYLDNDYCKFLRECAQQAVKEFIQVN